MRYIPPTSCRLSLSLMLCLLLFTALCAQNAAVSFRTGDPFTGWCPILDGNSEPIDSGSFIGIYLVGEDGEVDPPSEAFESCGEPTDDDIRATENTIGNGYDHLIMGFNEPVFIPAGNMFTGNGNIAVMDSGTGTEPVVNIDDEFYLRAFNSDSAHTATHYNNLFTVNEDTTDTYVQEGTGPTVVAVCFTEAIPLNCDTMAVSPAEGPNIVNEYRLYQNYPNPFNPLTTINFDVKEYGHVTLKIFNILGQQVLTLVDEPMDMGRYTTPFDATGLASGIYFYQLRVNNFHDIRKMVLLR